MESTYENVIAFCSHCRKRNVYNRRSDLNNLRPIDGADVTCAKCGKTFRIIGDMISPAHEMLLLGGASLLDGKQYMQTVLTVVQAYEVFFSHFLHVRLVYRPFARDADDIERFDQLKQLLYDKVGDFTFWKMRRVFLRLVVDECAPATIDAATAVIEGIRNTPSEVSKSEIQKLVHDERLREMLLRVLAADVSDLRNKVVHKEAYRPTREESQRVYEDACEVLPWLTAKLHIDGLAEHYINSLDD